jgi:ferrous iron transport protein B
MEILLVGNPNVGKSTLFSRMTGVDVVISNYSGTTVDFKQGKIKLNNHIHNILDVPGNYNLNPDCDAEKIAVNMLCKGDIIINVLDATNLERNLYLTLQLIQGCKPVIVVLNFWNETKHKGIDIDINKLRELLGVPVIPTTALTGEGIKDLVLELEKLNMTPKSCDNTTDKNKYFEGISDDGIWSEVGKITSLVQTIKSKKHSLFERFEDLSIKPITGLPIAIFVLFSVFLIIRFIGESLINYIFDPLFTILTPLLNSFSSLLGHSGFLHNILIGNLLNGEIDFVQSMGLVTTGLYVPIAMVLPYVFAFYIILGLLEDTGYLPRLATLVDNVMHKLGMHGLAVIPMLLGFGCNVPGAMATRVLETKRQRFIASTIMAICIPCMAQIAMIYGLLGNYGFNALFILFITLFIVWLILGLVMHRFLKGNIPETFMEIPPYRIPLFKAWVKKVYMRTKYFIKGAIPYMILGVFFVNLLYFTGIIEFIGNLASPVIVNILGLPKEAVASLIVGFLRKDVAVGMLVPLSLTMKQMIIACTVLVMYFPCVATFIVMFKELGIKYMSYSVAIMVFVTLLTGGILNLIL